MILFVSSGFLETEGLLLTILINKGGSRGTEGNHPATTPTEVTVVVMTGDCRPQERFKDKECGAS